MTAPTHAVGALSLFSLFSLMLPVLHLNFPTVLTAIIFGLLPDMDNPRSLTGRLLFFFSTPLDRNFGHRTIVHSLLFCFFVAVAFSALVAAYLGSFTQASPYFFAAFMGYFSHLMLDAMTKQGILFFYPSRVWCVLPKRSSWRIRTAHPAELLFFIFLTLTSVGLIQAQRKGIFNMFSDFFTYTGVDAKIQSFEHKKKAISHGANIDSLYQIGVLDKKEYLEMKTKLEQTEIEMQQYLMEQGLIRNDK